MPIAIVQREETQKSVQLGELVLSVEFLFLKSMRGARIRLWQHVQHLPNLLGYHLRGHLCGLCQQTLRQISPVLKMMRSCSAILVLRSQDRMTLAVATVAVAKLARME